MTESGQIIDSIFESSQFQILLKQQVSEIVNTISQSKKICSAAIPMMVTEIGNHLESIIDFRVKNSFNQQYLAHLQVNSDLRRDIDEMRSQLKKINCQVLGDKKLTISKFQTQQQLSFDKNKQKQQRSSTDALQITKLQKQIQNMKQSLQKVSHTSILQFVSETNIELHKRIDQKCNKLQHDIHEMTQRNLDTSLQKTTSDILDIKYQTLDQKLEGISKNQQQLITKFKTLQSGLMDKMETNFAGVWNVIGQIQKQRNNNHRTTPKQKQPELQNLRSFVSPTAKLAKKLQLSNLFNWN